jgi:hypothetical protein
MALQLAINYEQLLELVEQLTKDQQQDLMQRLLARHAQGGALTIEEKLSLLDAAKIDNPVNEAPSVRRADWYGDDGR